MMSKAAKTRKTVDLNTSIRTNPIKLVTPISGDSHLPTQNLVRLDALAAEEGIFVRDLFARTGIIAVQLEDVHARQPLVILPQCQAAREAIRYRPFGRSPAAHQ